jgi:uncharacterized OB-fold protein
MPSPRYWREIPARLRLEAGRCTGCGKVHYPARKVCPACRGTEHESLNLSPSGKLVTHTIIHIGPTEFQWEQPYAVAVLETPEGARLMAQVVDCKFEELKPGMEMDLEMRCVRKEGHAGILCYGHKAVPRS